jgi:hypothetical protein
MGRTLLKQPDGLLAVWSTIVDDFVLYNATPEEYEDFLVQEAVEEVRERAKRDLEEVERRGTNSRMGRTFESALAARNNRHGVPLLQDSPDPEDHEFACWVATHTPEGWTPDPDEDG